MAKDKVTVVTDTDIAEAEAALAQGRQALEDAREAYFNEVGSWEAVKSQEGVIEFAEARLIQLGRSRDRYNDSVRREAVEELAAELAAFDLGDTYEQLGRELAAKVEEFVQAFVDRNKAIAAFRRRAVDLNVPERTASKFASARHAYLELGPDGGLISAERVFGPKFSGVFVHEIIEGVRAKMYAASGADLAYFRVAYDVLSLTLDEVYTQLGSIDAEQGQSTAGHFFYRAAEWRTANPNATPIKYQPVQIQGGPVYRWADDLTEDEQRQRNVVKITEEDARGEY